MVGGLVLGSPGQNSSRQRVGRGGGNWKAWVERRERKGGGAGKAMLAGLDLSPLPLFLSQITGLSILGISSPPF